MRTLVPRAVRASRLFAAALATLLITGCSFFPPPQPSPTTGATAPTSELPSLSTTTQPATQVAPTLVPPTQAPAATAAPPQPTPQVPPPSLPPQTIVIETPPPGTLVGSPVVLTGRTDRLPEDGNLSYRVTDSGGGELGSGRFTVSGTAGGPGRFDASLTFNLPRDGGRVRVDVFEQSPSTGNVAASAGVDLVVDAQYQAITIETPAPGTQVGSPVVLTGRTVRLPFGRRLNYRVLNSGGQQIGAGQFDVFGNPGEQGRFNASLSFDLPINGDNVRVELFDRDPSNGAVVANTTLELVVAPVPQQIIIEGPPPGTTVGSPVVLTGRTARFPFNGSLGYRVLDTAGSQLGGGSFAVTGSAGQPTRFSGSLNFTLPRDGGTVRVELFDQNPANGAVVASSFVDLDVIPQYQAIFIETPPPGTQVGSPVVLTGRTNQYPNRGRLYYRITDTGGRQLGGGSFATEGGPGQRGRFSASLSFTLPPGGGTIRIELYDQADNGAVTARNAIDLVVAPQQQQIVIETPSEGTQVGSPVVVTGRTTLFPFEGNLSYRVRNSQGIIIGQGGIQVFSDGGLGSRFNSSLTFVEPQGGGPILVEIVDRDAVTGGVRANATVRLTVASGPGAQPRSP